jgi:hypothetical protein
VTPRSDTPLDRKLDETLRREYGDPNGLPAPPPPPPPAEPPYAPPPPPVTRDHDEWSDNPFQLRLGLLAAFVPVRLFDAKFTRADHGFSDDGWPASGHDDGDFGWAASARGAAWLDLGRYISIESAVQVMGARTRGDRHRDSGGWWWDMGPHPETRVDILTADANLVVHPINCSWGQIDLLIGMRYLSVTTKYRFDFGQGLGSSPMMSQNLEAAIPMIGIGGALRPVHTSGGGFTFEIYARIRAGGLDLENGGQRDRDWSDWRHERWLAASVEAEGGVRFIFCDMIGLSTGVRYEYNDLQKGDRDEDGTKTAEWRSVGPFLALIIQLP